MDNQRANEMPTTEPNSVYGYLNEVTRLLALLPVDRIIEIADLIDGACRNGNKVLLCGNGGSSATASHWATDLSKNASGPGRPRVRAMALTDCTPLVTALANDTHYDLIFAEQILTWAEPGDVVIAISGSGNSANVLRAVEYARHKGAVTVGLIGFKGGKLVDLVDHALVVASYSMEHVEDTHMVIAHAITALLRQRAATLPDPVNAQTNGHQLNSFDKPGVPRQLVVNER